MHWPSWCDSRVVHRACAAAPKRQQTHHSGRSDALTRARASPPCSPPAPQVAFLAAQGRSCKVIVYFLTCASVEWHALVLRRLAALRGLRVAALHGKLKQVRRRACLLRVCPCVAVGVAVVCRGARLP
jgi:superfamily II DNA/RNA helicase